MFVFAVLVTFTWEIPSFLVTPPQEGPGWLRDSSEENSLHHLDDLEKSSTIGAAVLKSHLGPDRVEPGQIPLVLP